MPRSELGDFYRLQLFLVFKGFYQMITVKLLAEQCGKSKQTIMSRLRAEDLLELCELSGNTYFVPDEVADKIRAFYPSVQSEPIEEEAQPANSEPAQVENPDKYISLLERQLEKTEQQLEKMNQLNQQLVDQIADHVRTITDQSKEINRLTEANSIQGLQLARYQFQEPKQEEPEITAEVIITEPTEEIEPVRESEPAQAEPEKLTFFDKLKFLFGM